MSTSSLPARKFTAQGSQCPLPMIAGTSVETCYDIRLLIWSQTSTEPLCPFTFSTNEYLKENRELWPNLLGYHKLCLFTVCGVLYTIPRQLLRHRTFRPHSYIIHLSLNWHEIGSIVTEPTLREEGWLCQRAISASQRRSQEVPLHWIRAMALRFPKPERADHR